MNFVTCIVLMFGMIVGGVPLYFWGKHKGRKEKEKELKSQNS